MNTIVYFVYGSSRTYQLELTYSVLSAMHFIGLQASDYRIVLVTDEAGRRPDLPVEHVCFTAEELQRWTRNGSYSHEAKIHALKYAMVGNGAFALIDTDTFFLAHPDGLFAMIGPGRAVMHARDGRLGDYRYWSRLLGAAPKTLGYPVEASSRMFNSGVVGIDAADRHLLDEVTVLARNLHNIDPVFSIEQFAFTAVLEANTELDVCPHLICHYWGPERLFMHAGIDALFPEFSSAAFERHLAVLPPIGYPPKRKIDQLRARLVAGVRRQSGDYRFAYLAYLSALSSAGSDPARANVWALIAAGALARGDFPSRLVRRDFAALRAPQGLPWLSAQAGAAWNDYWLRVDRRE